MLTSLIAEGDAVVYPLCNTYDYRVSCTACSSVFHLSVNMSLTQ